MNSQPAEALSHLNNEVISYALNGGVADEMQYRRFLRVAQSIAPGTIRNDTALVLVNGAFNRFEEADKAIVRAKRWSAISAENAYDLSAACVLAWRLDAALQFMRYAADSQVGNPKFIKGYYKFSLQACATESMQDAVARSSHIKMEQEFFYNSSMEAVARRLASLSISENQVTSYIQEAANIVRTHFEKQPFSLLVTHPRLVSDHEAGDDEIWFDFVLHTTPESGAQIEWDLAFADMPTVDDYVRDHINVGVRLVDRFEDMEIKAEVVS